MHSEPPKNSNSKIRIKDNILLAFKNLDKWIQKMYGKKNQMVYLQKERHSGRVFHHSEESISMLLRFKFAKSKINQT